MIYAHTVPGQPEGDWEPLEDHLRNVATLAQQNAAWFGWGPVGAVLGKLHDIGKVSSEFQSYLRMSEARRGPDHSTAGALLTTRFASLSRILAYVIAGHHAGLADAESLDRRLDPGRSIPSFDGWEQHTGSLPSMSALHPAWIPKHDAEPRGFALAFLTRMLFSCLVDADFIATESSIAAANRREVERGPSQSLADLLRRLHALQARQDADVRPLNRLRATIRDHAVAKANTPPGLFTLTVPTGGGKTLTSLAFALEHAIRHGLRRVIYVVPFTAIVEQTASVFRDVLGGAAVLEYHASFDWEDAERRVGALDADDRQQLARLRRAAENWDAPIVVTTSVQFFESLFAHRTSRCRKLHNLVRSVIVLDEAQSLPLPLLSPCLAAVGELARHYGSSVVLCTATQPAVRKVEDSLPGGLDLRPDCELAPDPPSLFVQLRRQRIERLESPVDDATITARFTQKPRMLCIVNSRRHAVELFDCVRDLDGAVHLSTLMCPRHRGIVLDTAKARLKAGAPVRMVSTSLVEAGVDLDFDEVWRAETGLDSVAQAAGRCNREGRLAELGRVVVFRPADRKLPPELRLPAGCLLSTMERFDDPLAPDAIRAYFRDLYANRGAAFFDSRELDGAPYPILRGIAEGASRQHFDFKRISRAFRMIEEEMVPVVVPWRSNSSDDHARNLLSRAAAVGVDRFLLRQLQGYVVPVPRHQRSAWLADGVVGSVHPALGEALVRVDDTSLYDASTGLRLFDPTYRNSADNLIE